MQMAEMPEHLLRRSAEAQAKALGVPVEEVLARIEAGADSAAESPPPAPPSGISEKLLQRTAEAKAQAIGASPEEVLAEIREELAPPPAPPSAPEPAA